MGYDPNSPAQNNAGLPDLDKIRGNTNALREFEAGENEPANPVACMIWCYTPAAGDWIVRQRNKTNTAWHDLFVLTAAEVPKAKIEAVESSLNTHAGKSLLSTTVHGIDSSYLLSDGAVTKAKLSDGYGDVTHQGPGDANYDLPSDTHSFYPRTKRITGNGEVAARICSGITNSSLANLINLYAGSSLELIVAQVFYITASSRDHWIYILHDKKSKRNKAVWSFPDHPSYGKGDDTPHPFADYWEQKLPSHLEIILVDNAILPELRAKESRHRTISEIVSQEYEVDFASRPVYEPREVIELDRWGDLQGAIMAPPEWKSLPKPQLLMNLKALQNSGRPLRKRRMVERLPDTVLYRKLRQRRR